MNRILRVMLCLLMVSSLSMTGCASSQWIYIASPANPSVIYVSELDLKTGEMSAPRIAANDVSTGFLALHPTKPILYAASNERNNVPKGAEYGGIRAYAINMKTGLLTQTGKVLTKDNGNTHIEVSRDGKVVVQCHYQGKGTSAVVLNSDGSLTNQVSHITHTGSSVNKRRQERPHPHGVAIHQNGKYVCVADLGNDHVEVFSISEKGALKKVGHWKAKPGAGPRHVYFHQNGKWLYCINELDSTMSVLHFDPGSGAVKEVQTINTLPEGFDGGNSTAEVVVHPNGKFVYGTNRGHESTVVFAINQKDGTLKVVQHEPTQGKHPRAMNVDPTGQIYIVCNTNSDNLVSFFIDAKTGKLKPTGHQIKIKRPMSVVHINK